MRYLLYLFTFLVYSLEAQDLKKIALVIGNSEYTSNESNWLKNPVNDAKLISSTLQDIGFEVILKTNLKNKSDFLNPIREFGNRKRDGPNHYRFRW